MNPTKLTPEQIAKLVQSTQAGQREAFGEIYDEFITPIYRYIFYRVERSEVEDLTEQVFLQALQKIKKYQPQKNVPFAAWLFRIAHNLIIDHYRLHSRFTITTITEDLISEKQEDDPVQNTEQKFAQTALAQAIRKLPASQQQVIVLKFINEFTNSEIAKVLAKKESAVRLIQFRALKNLRHLLKSQKRNKIASFTFKKLLNKPLHA